MREAWIFTGWGQQAEGWEALFPQHRLRVVEYERWESSEFRVRSAEYARPTLEEKEQLLPTHSADGMSVGGIRLPLPVGEGRGEGKVHAGNTLTLPSPTGRGFAPPDVIAGWSLGGWVAAWLTAHGYATPRKLVLIATPYRFIGEDGMSRQDFNAFAARYQADPESTMRSFQALMRMGDRVQEGNPLPLGEGRVRENINADADNALTPALSQRERETPSPWLPWLDVLRNCDAATLPPLPVAPLVIHGAGDRVVPVAQAMRWETPHRLILPHTGHAPHLHDPTACAQAITEYLG